MERGMKGKGHWGGKSQSRDNTRLIPVNLVPLHPLSPCRYRIPPIPTSLTRPSFMPWGLEEEWRQGERQRNEGRVWDGRGNGRSPLISPAHASVTHDSLPFLTFHSHLIRFHLVWAPFPPSLTRGPMEPDEMRWEGSERRVGSVCKVGTQDPENLDEELKPLVTVWSVPSAFRRLVMFGPFLTSFPSIPSA